MDKRTKLFKALAKLGQSFEFRALYDSPFDRTRSPLEAEMVAWIAGRAKAMGVPLTSEAALLVMTTVGKDPAECVAELDRLRARFSGRERAIGPEDLRGSLTTSYESTQFELAEALLAGDRGKAERSLGAIFGRGLKGRDGRAVDRGGLFPIVTSWLYQSFAKAYEGRFLFDRGMPAAQVAKELGVRPFADRFQAEVRNNPEPLLRRGLVLLFEAQRELRSSGEDAEWILQRFLHRYFAAVAAAKAERRAAAGPPGGRAAGHPRGRAGAESRW